MNAGTIERLPWDSEFFGVAIARSQVMQDSLAAEIAAARDKGIACLYLTVDALDTAAIDRAVRLGARLTDLRIELSTPFSALADVAKDEIRTAGTEDAHALADLSRELSASSRFSRDPRFPRAAVSDMYALWIERCLRDGVVVVPSGELCGFVGARRDGDATTIDLVYVTPEARSRKLAGASSRQQRPAFLLPS